MKRIIIFTITLILLLTLSTVIASANVELPVGRGIVLVALGDEVAVGNDNGAENDEYGENREGEVEQQIAAAWQFESTAQTGPTARNFNFRDGELWYTPVGADGENLDQVAVYLEPAEMPEAFEEDDIFIFVIDEDGERQSTLVRMIDDMVLATIHGAEPPTTIQVYIPLANIAVDEVAVQDALLELEEAAQQAERDAQREAEEQAREEMERIREERELASKQTLFDAIDWVEYAHQRHAGINEMSLLLNVELRRDSYGYWIVRTANETETAEVGTIVAISVWVLGASVFIALLLNLFLFATRGRK